MNDNVSSSNKNMGSITIIENIFTSGSLIPLAAIIFFGFCHFALSSHHKRNLDVSIPFNSFFSEA